MRVHVPESIFIIQEVVATVNAKHMNTFEPKHVMLAMYKMLRDNQC